MSVEVGTVLPGKVTGITNFGAFIDMGNRRTGLVHISEVSNSYVKDIKDVLTVGEEVHVKVVAIADDGKISLSIRQALPPEEKESREVVKSESVSNQKEYRKVAPSSAYGKTSYASAANASPSQAKSDDFDALMSAFLKDSDDRLTSLKRNTEGKRGGRGGRRS